MLKSDVFSKKVQIQQVTAKHDTLCPFLWATSSTDVSLRANVEKQEEPSQWKVEKLADLLVCTHVKQLLAVGNKKRTGWIGFFQDTFQIEKNRKKGHQEKCPGKVKAANAILTILPSEC